MKMGSTEQCIPATPLKTVRSTVRVDAHVVSLVSTFLSISFIVTRVQSTVNTPEPERVSILHERSPPRSPTAIIKRRVNSAVAEAYASSFTLKTML